MSVFLWGVGDDVPDFHCEFIGEGGNNMVETSRLVRDVTGRE